MLLLVWTAWVPLICSCLPYMVDDMVPAQYLRFQLRMELSPQRDGGRTNKGGGGCVGSRHGKILDVTGFWKLILMLMMIKHLHNTNEKLLYSFSYIIEENIIFWPFSIGQIQHYVCFNATHTVTHSQCIIQTRFTLLLTLFLT